eukprot:CAMPEP_0169437864 /NCGR_PEP_ID=MMETSP1042-20121227/6353_1 /TAXON_ID=464988 /ORGANISM="Hemiselmis andersenii, Strain CCMP1180" /LENGTH=149 /DNA_ID=CAMNT_0009548661 /DNA_START=143 /DNA_END=589 /DNA_ORIENTATION=+
MAFNNPSSTKPVSYASATKSLSYLMRAVVNACSRDDDEPEEAHLLRKKKKSTQENRTLVMSLCGCLCCLVVMVAIFVGALLSLSYPNPVPAGAHSLAVGPGGDLHKRPPPVRGAAAGARESRGRVAVTHRRAAKVQKNVDGLIGKYVGK